MNISTRISMHRGIVSLLGAFLLALTFLAQPLAGLAHEHRDVGDYTFTVGFINEPAIQGDTNGIWVEVLKGEEPVVGLADTLQAQVIFGDQTRDFELVPAWGEDGVYQAVFIPTEPGDYTFRFFGQIEGVDVDESFTSSPEGFDSVAPRADLEFPTTSEEGNSGSTAITVGMPLAAASLLVGGIALWGSRRRSA
jgi:hypothetical protein